YINAAAQYDFNLRIACPEGYDPNMDLVNAHSDRVEIVRSTMDASENSDLIVTDVWASMGQEEEQKLREKAFADYQVNKEVMAKADNEALFMHCLPAHRGEEVTADVIDAKDSVVWDEAENRLHAQKALLEFLMAKTQKS
ncbi:MAG TPA: ornithine carbamoyltransferase, partial [Thiomicrospira sp.]|nr:ornithine carbamoyltransferase [Thiomicrospira sp.]